MANSSSNPTNADYLNAINAMKFGLQPPAGYTLLFSTASDTTYAQGGLYANAYVNQAGQIIIAALGPVTTPGSPADPTLLAAARNVNLRIAANDAKVTTEMQKLADQLDADVSDAASSAGYSFSDANVFVTGNSEAGVTAQLLTQKYGYSGATWGAPGMPGNPKNTASVGSGLTNYIEALDPVGNLASDAFIQPEKDQFHFGNVVFIGTEQQSQVLAATYDLAMHGGDASVMQAVKEAGRER